MEDEEATETHITDEDAASAEDEALRDHLHPVGVVVATHSEGPVAVATLICLAAEDLLAATTDDAGLLVGRPQSPQDDHALGLAPQAAVVVDAGPDLISARDPDLRFVERTTIGQAVADVHHLLLPQ